MPQDRFGSAVGFFFARALHDLIVLDYGLDPVPIGLIHVAKGGTAIAEWTTYGGATNGKLYKDKIKPLQPFAIRGVLWYQGETDGNLESSALKYYEMLPALIANWRADWGQGEFPFNYVQLPPIARPIHDCRLQRDLKEINLSALSFFHFVPLNALEKIPLNEFSSQHCAIIGRQK